MRIEGEKGRGGGVSIFVSCLWNVNGHPFCSAFNSMGLLRSESCETSVFCLLLNVFPLLSTIIHRSTEVREFCLGKR